MAEAMQAELSSQEERDRGEPVAAGPATPQRWAPAARMKRVCWDCIAPPPVGLLNHEEIRRPLVPIRMHAYTSRGKTHRKWNTNRQATLCTAANAAAEG